MSLPDYLNAVPLDTATLCATCSCITDSKGERCNYCQSPTLTNLRALLELDRIPHAWLEALELMNS